MMEKKRSVGVTVFGIITIVIGLFIWYFNFGMLAEFRGQGVINKLMIFFTLIFGISFIISGIFILKLKNWARILTLVQMAFLAIIALPLAILVLKGYEFWTSYFISSNTAVRNILIVYYSVIILFFYYLTRPNVKEQFK